jgi:hypothetical protein
MWVCLISLFVGAMFTPDIGAAGVVSGAAGDQGSGPRPRLVCVNSTLNRCWRSGVWTPAQVSMCKLNPKPFVCEN